jgi:hypothetical protein
MVGAGLCFEMGPETKALGFRYAIPGFMDLKAG